MQHLFRPLPQWQHMIRTTYLINLTITWILSRIPCFWLRLEFLHPSLILLELVWMQFSKIQRSRAHGLAILNSGATHPRFLGKGHPPTIRRSNPQSGVPMALNLRSGRKNEIVRMISILRTISKSGATAVRAQSLASYAPL